MEAQLADPAVDLVYRAFRVDLGCLEEQPDGRSCGHQRQKEEGPASESPEQHRGDDGHDAMQEYKG